MTLTPDELTALTGTPIKRLQIAELKRRSYVYEVDRQGRAVVSRAYAEARLGGQIEQPKPAATPRFDLIQQRG